MLYSTAASPALMDTLRQLMVLPELSAFRLVGGTSLALQIGHRISVDIDLFTDKKFDSVSLQSALVKTFPDFQVVWQAKNGFSAVTNGVKTDFFDWHVPFPNAPLVIDNLRLLQKIDIAAMKFDAITTRKEKKDFVDVCFLLDEFSLADLIVSFRRMYHFMDYKFVLESLQAADLAEGSDDPLMIKPLSWEDAKKKIVESVRSFSVNNKNRAAEQQAERLRKAQELLRKKKDD